MFGKIKDMYQLQKQAKQIKNELRNIHIEAESGEVMVTINGEQEVIAVQLPETISDSRKLAEELVKALNKAIKKSHEVAAERMRGVMGDTGLADMLSPKK